MEGSRLVKRAKFEPIGDEINTATAFIQAASALDVAAQFAVESRDVEGLNTVASLYIELGARMLHAIDGEEDEDDEIDHEALARKMPLGFNPHPVVVPVEEPEKEITVDG
jgi:hypothetical protein